MAGSQQNMKKSNLIISGAAALVALVAVTGLAMSSYAADTDTSASANANQRGLFGRNLTDEQKTDMQAERDAMRAERDAEMQTVRDAIEAGDYNAWKSAMDEDAPILEKINEGNFSKLVEMHNLRQQADDIAAELGIVKGEMRGEGFGGGMKMGMRGGGGMGCNK